MLNIFTSYSREDALFVDNISNQLKSTGLEVWTDRFEIEGGQYWRTEIIQAIRKCDAVILILSPQSSKSKYVIKEVTIADENDKRIIPILYQKCKIPTETEFALTGIHIIDFTIQDKTQATKQLLNIFKVPDKIKTTYRTQRKSNRKTLEQILPGKWYVQLTLQTYWGPQSGVLNLVINHDHTFYLNNQFFRAQGNWTIPQFNYLILNGVQSNGYMNMPYYTVLQFTDISTNNLIGLTSANESAKWQRM